MALQDQSNGDVFRAGYEAAGGIALMTAPVWQMILQDITTIGTAIAAVCGAIIAVHSLLRMFRQEKERKLRERFRGLEK